MKVLTTRLLLFASLLLAGAAGTVSDYTVGPEDVLEIKVYDEEELSRTTHVTQKGSITLPLVGEVNVDGLTAAQIEEKLRTLYGADYLQNPQIFVTVREFKSKTVQVLGAVKSPGTYRLSGTTQVLDVLSLAGGMSESGGKNLLLVRPLVDPLTLDVHRLLVDGDTTQNVEVKGGDVVFVPRGDEIYVLGEVRNPGSLKFEEGMTVTQAISKTNGFTKTASKGKVQVVRVENDKKSQFDVNVKRIEAGKERDFALRARDLVVVPESIF